jgi:hypothetical protein
LSAPILLIALAPLIGNFTVANHRGDTFARDFATDMLNSVEPYGILISGGDNDTFPLWYAQEVEGVRKDVMVLVGMHLNTDWSVRQIIRRPVRAYESNKGPAIYSGRQWAKPKGPPLKMTFDEADSIPPYVELREPQVFRSGNIVATVAPGYLDREQLVTLRLIKDTFPERPIYFPSCQQREEARHRQLPADAGAGGAARRSPARSNLRTPCLVQDRFVDVKRTQALWKDYKAPDTLARIGKWIDPASTNIPATYFFAGYRAREALIRSGERDTADAIARKIISIAQVARLPREYIEAVRAQR